ncbi:uncharacterized protein LOC143880269 [Tasmannia lanceolata]|uniref:uncharacterized protein LOC143880269 n=1 Tax=Tasmannia lanceolata TaxID=3420 RepID=UPI0040632A9B
MANNLLDKWIAETIKSFPLRCEEWSITERFIGSFTHLNSRGINWKFLQAAAKCWDPVFHVFRFGSFQLCPIFEDWCALLKLPPEGLWIRPSSTDSPHDLFYKLFENKIVKTLPCLTEKNVQFQTLIELFSQNVDPTDSRFQKCRRNALVFAVFARHVLRRDSSAAPFTLLTIVDQINEGRNPVPTMLAETFYGLDVIASKKVQDNFFGCAKLLYVWLCEKLTILQPQNRIEYTLKSLHSWKTKIKQSQLKEWHHWLQTIKESQIRWVSQSCPQIVTSTCPYSFVHLMGLEKSSFYAPLCFPSQIIGILCPPKVITPPCCEDLTPDLIASIVAAWRNKITERRSIFMSKLRKGREFGEPANRRARINEP